MRFALSPENKEFAASIDDLLKDADVPSVIRSWRDGDQRRGLDLWARLADLGVTALLVPERWEGMAAEPIDVVVALERLGYHALPGPLVESIAVVPVLLSGIEDTGYADRYLPRVGSGELLATAAVAPHVPYAVDADAAGLVLHAEGDVLRVSQAGKLVSSVDKSRRLFSPGGAEETLASDAGDVIGRAFDFGALAHAAQLLGLGRWLLDSAVSYAKQRKQFGREIGQFQAIKHLLAEVVTELELARPLVFAAAVALAEPGGGNAARDVSAARVAAADAAYLAARVSLQVHGAIGYTAEHDVGLWLTKVRALMTTWGTQTYHRARVAGSWKDAT